MLKNHFGIYLLLPFILILFLSSCADNSTNPQPQPARDLLDVIQSIDGLSSFNSRIKSTNLDCTLTKPGSYTVFAPTDTAFSNAVNSRLDSLSASELEDVLSYHVVDDFVNFNNIDSLKKIQNIQGENIFVKVNSDGRAYINNNPVNGIARANDDVIYTTNSVLFPDAYSSVDGLIAKRLKLNSLYLALKKAGLNSVLENPNQDYTIFAPDNEAFQSASLPQNIADFKSALKYHVVEGKIFKQDFTNPDTLQTLSGDSIKVQITGSVVVINGEATIRKADIKGINGVVHIIDKVISPGQ